MIAVTSQSEALAETVKTDWELDYKVVSDPSLTLARRFDIAITPKDQAPHTEDFESGLSQPGLVILGKSGKLLVHWAIDPVESNYHGAIDRPLPAVVWAALQSALNGSSTVSLAGPRLDVEWLKANQPVAYKYFEDYLASVAS